MADWMTDWMADCMTDWMADYMTGWATDCMTDLMADPGWLTGWLGCCFIFFLFGVSRWVNQKEMIRMRQQMRGEAISPVKAFLPGYPGRATPPG